MNPGEFQVADLSLASFGRKEIQLAEHEMPYDYTKLAREA